MTRDVTVVGGGVAGCCVAWELAKAGHAVTLVERAVLGAGASGKALGLLVPFGAHVRGAAARLQRESIGLWPALAEDLSAAAQQGLRDLGTEELRVEGWFRGFELPDGQRAYQVDLGRVFGVFRAALLAVGVDIQTGRQVGRWAGRQGNRKVVWCAGVGNGAVLGDDVIAADWGQALRVRLPAELLAPVYGEDCYVVPTFGDGRDALVGSVGVESGVVDANVTARLMGIAGRLVGCGVGEIALLEAWVGCRAVSKPKLPLVRAVGPDVWAVAGLGRVGWCLGPMVGREGVRELGS